LAAEYRHPGAKVNENKTVKIMPNQWITIAVLFYRQDNALKYRPLTRRANLMKTRGIQGDTDTAGLS
jgi:hypothetical protein